MHRLAERRVTYLWLTIALALIAALGMAHRVTIPGQDANENGYGNKAHGGLSQRSLGEQRRLERGDRASAGRGIHGRRSA